jgi:uncharacterized membrane protein/thiol-disulfide isomerase/thioredoxin
MRKSFLLITFFALTIGFLLPMTSMAQSADESVVQAVLFYSPTCPHCHTVINELLLPMMDEYGDQLQIMAVDVSRPEGAQLYDFAVMRYKIPDNKKGVPTLIVGDTILVGDGEIPELFPGIVKDALAADGIPWPALVASLGATSEDNAEQSGNASASDPRVSDLSDLNAPPPDPIGMTLASLILGGMAVALAFALLRLKSGWANLNSWFNLRHSPPLQASTPLILLLVGLGLVVAGYLAYVEITRVEAVCGPVGECNIVQASPYAQLAGIPIAVLGLLSYLSIGLLWLTQKFTSGKTANLAISGLLGLSLFGVLFSIYLTALEILVIKAVCIWCLSSAVITTLLMLLIVGAATKVPELRVKNA